MVQSLLGVGILLFGTPALLIMGYSYQESLTLILPPSVFISLLQVIRNHQMVSCGKEIYIYTLPMIILGLSVVIYMESMIDIKYAVGAMLIAVGVIRSHKIIRIMLRNLLIKHSAVYYMMMGAVHGISNMGGGLLVVLMGTRYINSESIRANIAFGYLLFGIMQLIVLFIFSGLESSAQVSSLYLVVIALLTYLFAEKFIVMKINETNYQSFITSIIFIYGVSVLSVGLLL